MTVEGAEQLEYCLIVLFRQVRCRSHDILYNFNITWMFVLFASLFHLVITIHRFKLSQSSLNAMNHQCIPCAGHTICWLAHSMVLGADSRTTPVNSGWSAQRYDCFLLAGILFLPSFFAPSS